MMRNRSTRARKRRRLKSKTLKYRTVMSSGGHLPDRVDPNSIAGAQFVSDFDSLYSVDATAAITRDENWKSRESRSGSTIDRCYRLLTEQLHCNVGRPPRVFFGGERMLDLVEPLSCLGLALESQTSQRQKTRNVRRTFRIRQSLPERLLRFFKASCEPIRLLYCVRRLSPDTSCVRSHLAETRSLP